MSLDIKFKSIATANQGDQTIIDSSAMMINCMVSHFVEHYYIRIIQRGCKMVQEEIEKSSHAKLYQKSRWSIFASYVDAGMLQGLVSDDFFVLPFPITNPIEVFHNLRLELKENVDETATHSHKVRFRSKLKTAKNYWIAALRAIYEDGDFICRKDHEILFAIIFLKSVQKFEQQTINHDAVH